MALSTCRFCKEWRGEKVKYGVRHYAHFDWQIRKFPYRILKDRNLLDHAMQLAPE